MKFSYNWLKELTGIKEPPEKLAEFLELRAFEVELLQKVGNDWTLDVKLFPNRIADASGHIGMAREIATLKKSSIKYQAVRIKEDKKKRAKDILSVKIENLEDCRRYTARVMKGITIKPSPQWLRERLATCGIQSINNIVDAANYVMLKQGQPLHVFDFEKIHGGILIRRAKPEEPFLSLDGKSYTLNPEILVIADTEHPVAIAGLKGGKESGVTEKTHTIILESANFDPVRIRLGSRALKLQTDASYRFERGLDPNQTDVAIDRLAQLIQEVADGTILAGRVDAYPAKRRPAKILFRADYTDHLIGQPLGTDFYKKTLQRLGWKFTTKGKNQFVVEPSTNRLDIQIEEDMIEEIVRILGYEKIRPRMPEVPLAAPNRAEEHHWEERMRDFAVAAGYTESLVYEFTGERELKQFRMDLESTIEIENPTRPETQYLVPRIILKYILQAAENLREHDAVQIFGIAKSFPAAVERKDLVLATSRRETPDAEAFYQLKGTIEQMFERMGMDDVWFDDAGVSDSLFHSHRVAEIKVGDEKIGILGELHPVIQERLKARARIVAAEIYFDKLWRLARSETEYQPVSKYPAIIRDIAVIVPEEVRTTEVENIIENQDGKLLVDTDLFDYFQDTERLGEGKKNLAFHLVFQSSERTLMDKEVNDIVQKIITVLEEKGWEVKK